MRSATHDVNQLQSTIHIVSQTSKQNNSIIIPISSFPASSEYEIDKLFFKILKTFQEIKGKFSRKEIVEPLHKMIKEFIVISKKTSSELYKISLYSKDVVQYADLILGDALSIKDLTEVVKDTFGELEERIDSVKSITKRSKKVLEDLQNFKDEISKLNIAEHKGKGNIHTHSERLVYLNYVKSSMRYVKSSVGYYVCPSFFSPDEQDDSSEGGFEELKEYLICQMESLLCQIKIFCELLDTYEKFWEQQDRLATNIFQELEKYQKEISIIISEKSKDHCQEIKEEWERLMRTMEFDHEKTGRAIIKGSFYSLNTFEVGATHETVDVHNVESREITQINILI